MMSKMESQKQLNNWTTYEIEENTKTDFPYIVWEIKGENRFVVGRYKEREHAVRLIELLQD